MTGSTAATVNNLFSPTPYALDGPAGKRCCDVPPSRYLHTSNAEFDRPIAEIVAELKVNDLSALALAKVEAEARKTDKAVKEILKTARDRSDEHSSTAPTGRQHHSPGHRPGILIPIHSRALKGRNKGGSDGAIASSKNKPTKEHHALPGARSSRRVHGGLPKSWVFSDRKTTPQQCHFQG